MGVFRQKKKQKIILF